MSRIDMVICLTEAVRVLEYSSSEEERKDADMIINKFSLEISDKDKEDLNSGAN